MLIFLYGPDEYRRSRKKKEIIAEFEKKRSDLGLASFDGESAESLAQLAEFLKTQSIFDVAKLAIIENAFEIDPPKLAAVLKPLVSQKDVNVLISEKSKPVKALAFLLEKPTFVQQFEALAGAEWTAFIHAEAKKNGLTLSPSAAQFLGTVYAGNSWGLATELEKLLSFGKAAIEKSDLDGFDLEAAPNYWALLNGLKSADIKNRLSALETLFAINDPAPKIWNIIAAQAGERAPHMAEYDLKIKSGKLEYEEALVDFVIS